jgi:hypothetical protein
VSLVVARVRYPQKIMHEVSTDAQCIELYNKNHNSRCGREPFYGAMLLLGGLREGDGDRTLVILRLGGSSRTIRWSF